MRGPGPAPVANPLLSRYGAVDVLGREAHGGSLGKDSDDRVDGGLGARQPAVVPWSHFRDGRTGIEQALRSAPVHLRERVQLLDSGIGTDVAAMGSVSDGITRVTRGFLGSGGPRDPRLPPGQYDTGGSWPVLTAEAAPELDLGAWTFRVERLVEQATTWTWDEMHALPPSTYLGAIHGATAK